ncbi:HD domain-containing protein [Clostridium beijerinckii]|uniref:HD domain-containing protein n=1 Tax=Clostridium beijerinckii TaxID=1520 RepID=UPI0022E912E9|nr:HD domain-containing protein [Clostridium beijerinckii]
MELKLDDLYAYRFYEKKDGPLVTIRQFNREEISDIGYRAGITNIQEIYQNRIIIEDLLLKLFIKKGGQPKLKYPYYAAVYCELPKSNQLHVRFDEPECIKIPMSAFAKEHVSFTYGQSPRALTRKDNHPTRRKLLMWDEVEKVINEFPFDENEDIWIEMQIWDESVIRQYYENTSKNCVKPFQVSEKLTLNDENNLKKRYSHYLELIKEDYFFEPKGVHGISHAIRVLILSQELSEQLLLEQYYKSILIYCAAFHDIGRENDIFDDNHGFKSYKKVESANLFDASIDGEAKEIIRFIIENHDIDPAIAKNNLENYLIKDKEIAYKAYCILKDADTLDRCRFGYIDKFYLCFKSSWRYIPFAYQLLKIFREVL